MNGNKFDEPLAFVPPGSIFLGSDQILAKQKIFPSVSALVGAH